MFRIQTFSRFFHCSPKLWSASESPLSHLRKKTGYALNSCRQALETNENDLHKAELWLNEQAIKLGWNKANVKPINKSIGLVGLKIEANRAVIAELNCDTDFVALNSIFLQLLSKTLNSCHQMLINRRYYDDYDQVFLNKSQIEELKDADGSLLSEQIMITSNKVKENVSVRRAICIKVRDTDIRLAGYVHPNNTDLKENIEYGKFATILTYQVDPEINPNLEETKEFAKEICQHIIGMNPLKIGSFEDDTPTENDPEPCLIFQDFLFDESCTVGQAIDENGLKLIDFKRIHCGEPLTFDDTKTSVSKDTIETC